jgi:hypothetical protein
VEDDGEGASVLFVASVRSRPGFTAIACVEARSPDECAEALEMELAGGDRYGEDEACHAG